MRKVKLMKQVEVEYIYSRASDEWIDYWTLAESQRERKKEKKRIEEAIN